MKKLFRTWVALNILCFIPSKIYTQNISYHQLTIDVADAISNSAYLNRIPFEAACKPNVLKNNNLTPYFSRSSLLANDEYMNIILREQYLRNRAAITQDTLTLHTQYFGLINAVLFHPFTPIFSAFNGNEAENKSINTYSKTSLGKFNRKYPAVTCTPPDCAAQWNGNN